MDSGFIPVGIRTALAALAEQNRFALSRYPGNKLGKSVFTRPRTQTSPTRHGPVTDTSLLAFFIFVFWQPIAGPVEVISAGF